MTSYVAIANGEIDQDSPVTQALMTALRDNPIAITEGAVGAPRLGFAALGAWYSTAGAVGTYVFARRGTGSADIGYGGTVAGSDLVPTGAWSSSDTSSPNGNDLATGAALSGTWRAMGYYDYSSSVPSFATIYGATLWQRIA